jgi:hypothetical protein
MKAIEKLTNVEKAKLLHQLFPGEIVAFLDFVQDMCDTVQEEEKTQGLKWDDGLITFDFWLSLVNQIDRLLKKYSRKQFNSEHLFADQLFDGYLAMYMVHCLIIYTTTRILPNSKFTKAVDLLFNP